MTFNRLAPYFKALEGKQYHSIRAKLAFETLIEARSDDFFDALEKVVQQLINAHPPDTQVSSVDYLLEPCFDQCLLTGDLRCDSFKGGPREARRALALAAVLYVLGWNRITARAQQWCCHLLECSVSSTLPAQAVRDLLTAKTYAGNAVSRILPVHCPSEDSDQLDNLLVDPFIGL